jgi:hypothetical protein
MSRKVTSLAEIKKQTEPVIIDIPGFKPGAVINVAVQPVDLTPHMLEAGIGNPLVISKRFEQTGGIEFGEELSMAKILKVLDAIIKEALVEPKYEDVMAVAPLTLTQKMAIFGYVIGDVTDLASFRGQRGIRAADSGSGNMAESPVRIS